MLCQATGHRPVHPSMLEACALCALLRGCPHLASPPPPHEAALAVKRRRLGAGGHSHAGGNRRVNMGEKQPHGATTMGVARHFGRGQPHHREARARAKMAAGQPAPPRPGRRGPARPRPASARMQTGAHRKWFSPCRKCSGSGAVAGRRWQRAGSGAAGRWAPSSPGAAARAEGSGPPAVALPLPPSPLEEGKGLPASVKEPLRRSASRPERGSSARGGAEGCRPPWRPVCAACCGRRAPERPRRGGERLRYPSRVS